MVLPTSGQISLVQIADEFKCEPNLVACAVAAGLPTTNISFSDFYGLSSGQTWNFNVELLEGLAWAFLIYVDTDFDGSVDVGSVSPSTMNGDEVVSFGFLDSPAYSLPSGLVLPPSRYVNFGAFDQHDNQYNAPKMDDKYDHDPWRYATTDQNTCHMIMTSPSGHKQGLWGWVEAFVYEMGTVWSLEFQSETFYMVDEENNIWANSNTDAPQGSVDNPLWSTYNHEFFEDIIALAKSGSPVPIRIEINGQAAFE